MMRPSSALVSDGDSGLWGGDQSHSRAALAARLPAYYSRRQILRRADLTRHAIDRAIQAPTPQSAREWDTTAYLHARMVAHLGLCRLAADEEIC